MNEMYDRIIDAKDKQFAFQKEMLKLYDLPLISLTLNLPGGFELYEEWTSLFIVASNIINDAFDSKIIKKVDKIGKWGPEGFWVVNDNARIIKQKSIELEVSHPLGRLFDIDVFDKDGNLLSRTDFSIKERECIVCNNPAIICYLGKKHTLTELRKNVGKIIYEGLNGNDR